MYNGRAGGAEQAEGAGVGPRGEDAAFPGRKWPRTACCWFCTFLPDSCHFHSVSPEQPFCAPLHTLSPPHTPHPATAKKREARGIEVRKANEKELATVAFKVK